LLIFFVGSCVRITWWWWSRPGIALRYSCSAHCSGRLVVTSSCLVTNDIGYSLTATGYLAVVATE